MKNLNLSILKQYYDQIKEGTKKIEYREIKDYYTKKLIVDGIVPGEGKIKAVHFDTVTFHHRGDPPMKVKWEGLFLYPKGNPKWYAIKLGEIISPKE